MNNEDGTPVPPSCPKEDGKIIYGLVDKDKECYGKLIAVLIKILQPNFKTSDDTVITKLFDFIVTQGSRSPTDRDILTQILGEWLKRICNNWATLTEESKVLALKVSGYVASCPAGYSKFASTVCLGFLLSGFQDPHKNSNAINLGHICLMESLISNVEGSRIILDSGIWKKVVNMVLTSNSIYCVRQSTKLLATILKRADVKTSEIIFHELTKIRVKSQLGSPSENEPNSPSYDPSTGEDLIVCTLSACRTVILNLIEEGHPANRINGLIKSCDLTRWTWEIIKSKKRKRILEAANRLICVINSLLFYQCKDEKGLIPFETSKHIMDVILDHLNALLTQDLFYEEVDACVDYAIYLQKFGATVAPEKQYDSQGKMITEVPFCIHNLLLVFHAFPMFMCLKVRDQNSMVDVHNEYIDKLCTISNSNVLRACYGFRDTFVRYGEKVCILSVFALKKFMQICPIMRKEQGILVFQATVHLLGEFIAKPEEGVVLRTCRKFNMEGEEFIAKYPSLLSAALNCLHCYISKFDFSWRDSLESLNLMPLLQKVLDSRAITPQITIETLKAIDLVLQKFMPSNLALLVDTIKDSSIEDLGAQLFRLLHHEDWAVRDSALEIVRTLSSLSGSRFPAFQTLLLECRLPEVVTSIIETDPESFVKATALSCLHELVKVRNIWRSTLLDKNVVGKLLLILTNESEGIVRVGAAKCITVMHSRRMLSSNDLELVYDVMSHTARNDLHWEVKVESLEFWRSVLCLSVVDQGMIDGDFPEFVFSKEQKKIIKLTPNEIAQSLSRTLKMLGDIGCLQVLFDTFNNDPDLSVQQKASNLLKNVIYLIRRWRVNTYEDCRNSKCPVVEDSSPEIDQNEWDFLCCETMDFVFSNKASEEIIEQIVSQTDIELLKGIADIGLEVRKTLPPIERVVMTDKEFVRKMRGVNVDKVMEGKTKWICNASQEITSLLDDILLYSSKLGTLNGSGDRNAVDCY